MGSDFSEQRAVPVLGLGFGDDARWPNDGEFGQRGGAHYVGGDDASHRGELAAHRLVIHHEVEQDLGAAGGVATTGSERVEYRITGQVRCLNRRQTGPVWIPFSTLAVMPQ